MKLFDTAEWAVINGSTSLLDNDKDTFEVRLHKGLEIAREVADTSVELVAYKYLTETYHNDEAKLGLCVTGAKAIADALEGSTDIPVGLDCASSGLTIFGCMTRCRKTIEATGVLGEKPGDFYSHFGENLGNLLTIKGTVPTRKELKACLVPYYYMGLKGIEAIFGKDQIPVFQDKYLEICPGAGKARDTLVASWDSNATRYQWATPDGYEPMVYVIGDNPDSHMEYYNQEGKQNFSCTVRQPKPKVYRMEAKTLGLGSHVVHAMDAFILREVIRASTINTLKIMLSTRYNPNGVERITKPIQAYYETGIISLEIVSAMAPGVKLPDDVYTALTEYIGLFATTSEDYYVWSIHDEFRVLPHYVDNLRRSVNVIYANIYKGEYIAYLNKKFKCKIEVSEYSEEMYNAILNCDYLMS